MGDAEWMTLVAIDATGNGTHYLVMARSGGLWWRVADGLNTVELMRNG